MPMQAPPVIIQYSKGSRGHVKHLRKCSSSRTFIGYCSSSNNDQCPSSIHGQRTSSQLGTLWMFSGQQQCYLRRGPASCTFHSLTALHFNLGVHTAIVERMGLGNHVAAVDGPDRSRLGASPQWRVAFQKPFARPLVQSFCRGRVENGRGV